MKFSDNQNYLEYMDHYAHEHYELARFAIYRCIEDLKTSPNSIQLSELLALTGKLFFMEGNVREAIHQYELSEAADSESLLPKYFFAKFLGEFLKDHIRAIQKCDEIIYFATRFPFPNTEDDYGSDDYINMAIELKNQINGNLR